MQINILVDFGQGYIVSLTPQDARQLWNQLGLLYGELAPQGYWQQQVSLNTEVKPSLAEESPERCANLDECVKYDPRYTKCYCNTCATKEYMEEFRSRI